ncbi:MAG: hypothetical protein R3B97_10815 [Dehalococcoidia bacterium]|nr:hypothetical protein [Dehalococcoidia bacterium]
MTDTASSGNGEYYKAHTTADLDEAFRDIAEKTRVSLTSCAAIDRRRRWSNTRTVGSGPASR